MRKEYIEREAALDAITYNALIEPTESDIVALTLAVAQKNIRKVPATDVIAVTRCKDCKYCDKYTKWNNKEYLGCSWNGEIYEVEAEHYCSYGERRTEDEV